MKQQNIDQINYTNTGIIYKFSFIKYFFSNFFPICFLFVSGFIIISTLIMRLLDIKTYSNDLIVIVIILVSLLGFIWLKVVISMNSDKYIEEFVEGINYNDKRLRKFIHWSDINEIKHKNMEYSVSGLTYFSINDFTITTFDNTKITIDKYFKYNNLLIELILNKTYEIMFQKYKKIFNEGGNISLGKYQFNKLCIRKNNKSLSWNDVIDIQLVDGIYTIHKKDRLISDWGAISTSDIINYHVIIPLIDKIIKNEL